MSFAHGIVEDDRGASHRIFTHQILPSHFEILKTERRNTSGVIDNFSTAGLSVNRSNESEPAVANWHIYGYAVLRQLTKILTAEKPISWGAEALLLLPLAYFWKNSSL